MEKHLAMPVRPAGVIMAKIVPYIGIGYTGNADPRDLRRGVSSADTRLRAFAIPSTCAVYRL
jgi:hypothetical protein